jgi:serine/threonine protein kinase
VLHPGEILDGYRLIRPIGSGGFGEVWLCQSDAVGDFRALKFIPATSTGHLEKEFDSICKYRAAATQLRSPSLMPIEHVNRRSDGLFYIMPLSDGYGVQDPTHEEWHPLTMAAILEGRRRESTWFTSEEIRNLITPILQALQLLSDAGLVHRDVKPENILFVNSLPCLGDISLLGNDTSNLTQRGTPGYSAPSWFVESGGHPDMYGSAMTLYAILTGNPPDKMGRAAFRWPPQGEQSLSATEREAWLMMHRAIRRAVEDRPAERFVDFVSFQRGLSQEHAETKKDTRKVVYGLGACLTVLLTGGFFYLKSNPTRPQPQPSALEPSTKAQRVTQDEQAEIEKFKMDLANVRREMLYDRGAFAKTIDELTEELNAFLNNGGYLQKGAAQKLANFKERFFAVLKAIPKPPSTEAKAQALQVLHNLAKEIGGKYGAGIREDLNEQIAVFTRQLDSEKEFRSEQISKIRPIVVDIMNKSIFHPTFRFDRSKTETEEAEENEKQESASSVRSLAGDIVSEAQHFWR